MELYSAEAKSIETQIQEWLQHPEYELETTFGAKGTVDATTFLTVAKRLRAKGYTSLPQEDRLTVTTRDHVRFTLSSLGIIQQYCRDDMMNGKPFVAMIKDRTAVQANVDLDEYGVRIKTRRELPMASDDAEVKKLFEQWPRVQKAFRMIRRWSFDGDGIRIDMSIVRSTKKDLRGEYRWQRRFRDQEVMQATPTYEIEVELLRKEGDTAATALKRLVRGVGEVLRGIQKNSILIRQSVKTRVLAQYRELVGSDRFRGPAPRTLQKKNFLKEKEDGEANLRDGYNVTDKADGLRCLAYCDGRGELFLIDMGMNVYRTGLKQPECRMSLLDGEWVTLTADRRPIQQYLAFDIFLAVDKTDVSQLPFQSPNAERPQEGRHGQLEKWMQTWNKGDGPAKVATGLTPQTQLQVSMKSFLFARAGDESIFRAAGRVLDTARIYYTDGLIFTPNALPLPAAAGATFFEQFKWKPPKDNTVDFLVTIEKQPESKHADKITVGVHPDSGETVTYKTVRLFVGSSSENPRDVILNMLELPKKDRMVRGGQKGVYKPALFTPKEFPDPMASTCYLAVQTDPDTGETYVMTEDTEEPIQDRTIVEMAYDPAAAAGWRWRPLRVRMDKTERLQSGTYSRTLNSDKVAEDVWNSIYDPISLHMIRSGAEQPSDEEQLELMKASTGSEAVSKKYYDRKAPVQDQMIVRGLRDFHNQWIKEKILYRAGLSGGGKTLIDVACGRGADLQKWRRAGAAFVLGADYSGENIRGEKDGAYRRYMDTLVNAGSREAVAPMIFVIADSSKTFVTGDAGVTDEEKNILRSVLGRVRPTGPVPAFVEKEGAGRLKVGADCMSCMFALHYFFETPDTFRGFIKNIADNLKVGGHFIGCCFDGEAVFNLLRPVPKGGQRGGMEKGANLWTITKQYDEDDLVLGDESLGLAVDVEFITIGTTHREYLVHFPTLVEAMKGIGCELMGAEDLKKVGLAHSTAMFKTSWDMAAKAGKKYLMTDSVQQFSFLNRWFVFKRTSAAGPLDETKSGLASVKAAAAAAASVAPEAVPEEETTAAVNAVAAAPPAAVTADKRTYAVGEVFQFFSEAAEKDVLRIKDPGAARWLAPSSLFPIEDPYDPATVYPSMEHYLAAMRYRVASNKPELAGTIFGREGTIHQEIERQRTLLTEGGKKQLTDAEARDLRKEELTKVRDATKPAAVRKYKAVIDEAKWATKKDEVLRAGLTQRWERDARFRKIVEAARDQGKTLLYYTPGANSSNMGGVRKADGTIQGENKIGQILMELAGF